MKKNPLLLIGIVCFIVGLIFIITGVVFSKTTKTKSSESGTEGVEYQFEVHSSDMAETVTTYQITVKEKEIDVYYKNVITYPDQIDGPTPKPSSNFTITDNYFMDPLKQLFQTWEKENGSNPNMDGDMSLILSQLEKSQNRNEDLCVIQGKWYCEMYEDVMDYNSDGKITVEESFAYFVDEIDPSISLIE